MTLSFTVLGVPRGAGSKHGFAIKKAGQYTGRVAMVDTSGAKGRDWRQSIVQACFDAMRAQECAVFDCPLILTADFTFPRPKSHYRSGKFSNEMRPDAPMVHSIAPDATKVTRALEDALNRIAFRDDSLICRQIISKRYANDSEPPGVSVKIEPYEKSS